MKRLETPYRCSPADSKCYYRMGNSRFYHAPLQKNLYLRPYVPEKKDLLSVMMVCRTLAMTGDWHRRVAPDFLTVTYIHSGETLVRVNEFSFLAEPGDLILMPPGSDYEFGSSKSGERSAIVLQGVILESVLRRFGSCCVFPDDPDRRLEKMVGRFFCRDRVEKEQLASWSFDLLSALHSGDSFDTYPGPLEHILRQMKRNVDKDVSLSQFSHELGMTSRTLSRLFRKFLKTSPHQYLISMKMHQASQMLAMEELSIKEIAISAGYRNPLNFSTTFRKFFGCSPSAYRKNLREKPDSPTV